MGGWGLTLSCNSPGRYLAEFGHGKLRPGGGFGVAGACRCLRAAPGFTRMRGRQLGTSWACDFFCGHVDAVKSGCLLFRATDAPCSDTESSSSARGPHTVPCSREINPGWSEVFIRCQPFCYGKKIGFSSKCTTLVHRTHLPMETLRAKWMFFLFFLIFFP